MPGVLMLEALAQSAGILCFVTADIYPDENVKFYFAGIDKARFRRPVVPGDQLLLKVTLERRIRTIWKFSTVAEVDGRGSLLGRNDGDARLIGRGAARGRGQR